MLIIITAHIPIFTLQRHEGRIFAPMAWTVTSALVGSLLLSLSLVPLLCYFLFRGNTVERENIVIRKCKDVYRPVLVWALAHRWRVIGAALLALAASLVTLTRLGSEFLPELNEGTMWVNIFFPPGISLNETKRLAATVREILHGSEVVKTVTSKAGRPEDGTDPKPINMAEFFRRFETALRMAPRSDARPAHRPVFKAARRIARRCRTVVLATDSRQRS
jgi:cobalt-zinc-cadmium resistance protein CzcA